MAPDVVVPDDAPLELDELEEELVVPELFTGVPMVPVLTTCLGSATNVLTTAVKTVPKDL